MQSQSPLNQTTHSYIRNSTKNSILRKTYLFDTYLFTMRIEEMITKVRFTHLYTARVQVKLQFPYLPLYNLQQNNNQLF